MVRAALAVAVLILALAGAYALGVSHGRDRPALERTVVGASTDDDAVRDKWVTAECPKGTTAIGGGAHVPHANDTPGVALYWSAPYEDHGVSGWWAAAQDTRDGKRPWLLQVEAICADGVTTRASPAGSLPPVVYSPAG